jgi:hypothetical protein
VTGEKNHQPQVNIRNQKPFINGQKNDSRMKTNKVITCSVGEKSRCTKPNGKMLIACCIFISAIASPYAVRAQETLNYVLMPDSTFTPTIGGDPTGPSQPLTGSFSWVQYIPSDILDCNLFTVTALNFQTAGYTLTLADESPDSVTPADPNGQTDMDADVNWGGGPAGLYFIGGFAEGTYTGQATAPTELKMTEGLGIATGGLWQAYLYIDAVAVPEPTTLALSGVGGLAALMAARNRKSAG